MKHTALKYGALAACLLLAALPALAQLPARDLVVELRQVQEGADTSYTVSTQADDGSPWPQQVRVRNGAKASLNLGKIIPMQWVQSVVAQSASLAASGVSARSRGGGVTHALTWMNAGQGITVQPRWPGGKQVATVDIELTSASVQARIGAELADQSSSQIATSVSAPLGQWVTIAASGKSAPGGVYGSESASDARRFLQLRVLAP